LLEPQRTNSITYSEDYSQSNWVKTGLTINVNKIVSPDGSLNSDEVNITAANAHYLFDTISVSASTNYTFTFYVKKGTATDVSYSILNATNFTNIVNTTSYFNEISDTDWTRISVEFTTPSGCTSIRTYPLRDGSSTGTVYIWGAQLEQGSYATSYTPTEGSTVTRLADSCSQTPTSGIIGQTEGTMFFKIDFANISGVAGAWSITSGSSANRITMNTTSLSSTQFTLSVAQNYNSGSTKLASANVTFSDKHKVAIKYSGTTLKLFVDGQLSDSVSTDGFGNYTKFYVGGNQVGAGGDARKFIQANLYNTALSDSELQALTTI